MHVERRAGRAVAALGLIGLLLVPGATTAQQAARPRVGSQPRIPVRVVASTNSSIPVRVADAPMSVSTAAGEDRVFITNTPGSALVMSLPGRSTGVVPSDVLAGPYVGGDSSWMADDGVAWLPQQNSLWPASPDQAPVLGQRSTDVAELAGVRAYLSSNSAAQAGGPTVVDLPPVSPVVQRRLPRQASMNGAMQSHGQSAPIPAPMSASALRRTPAAPAMLAYAPTDDFAGLGASFDRQSTRPRSFASGDYRLGPGDQVDVFVWRNEELSRRVPVRPDGYISLPLVGELKAAGKTAAQLESEITSLLLDFVQMPTVTVSVTDIKSLVVYVLGRVGQPGPVTLDRNINVLQAISMAGGPTEFANQNGVTILRTVGNQRVRIPYRYGDVMKGRADTGELVLQAGDVIYVP